VAFASRKRKKEARPPHPEAHSQMQIPRIVPRMAFILQACASRGGGDVGENRLVARGQFHAHVPPLFLFSGPRSRDNPTKRDTLPANSASTSAHCVRTRVHLPEFSWPPREPAFVPVFRVPRVAFLSGILIDECRLERAAAIAEVPPPPPPPLAPIPRHGYRALPIFILTFIGHPEHRPLRDLWQGLLALSKCQASSGVATRPLFNR
jgi:hypothetical protein